MAKLNKMSGFKIYNGTKADFIAAGFATTYADAIVFIKGGADAKGSCIYAQGMYFANFAEFLSAINYVKGIVVGDTTYNAAAGGGYVGFGASDPATLSVDVQNGKVTVGLSDAFVAKVNSTASNLGSTSDVAKADGSAFARIAALAEALASLTGSSSGSIADQIAALKQAIEGNLAEGDATTLKAINDELDAIGSKWASYVSKEELSAIGDNKDDGDKVNVKVTTLGGKVTAVEVTETGLTTALNSKANAADVYTKSEVDNTLSGYYTKSETFNKNEVTQAITNEVAKIINDNDGTSINTLEEIAAWIAAHPDSVAAINKAIKEVSDLVGTTSVESQINTKISGLNQTDKAVAGQYVSAVSETAGVITVTRENLPTYTLVEGATNGTVKFNGTEVKVHGLGSAAYTDVGAYATSAQGTKADGALQEITKLDSDYATVTVGAKNANKQSVKVDVKVKAVADATAAKQGFADAYDVNQAVAGAKTYADSLFVWEEL